MRVNPVDPIEKQQKLFIEAKRIIAIAVVFITVLFFFIKIVFL